MSGPTYPRCKNPLSVHGCHPYFAKKYDGFCLECENAGVPEFLDQIEKLKSELQEHQMMIDLLNEQIQDLQSHVVVRES